MKILFCLFLASTFVFAAKPAPKEIWTIGEGLQNPESAYYDAASGILFVSNVAGVPNQKDGIGWISQVTPEGKMLNANWVTGLHAPKGMRSHKGTLWVADIDRVLGIDIKTGKIQTAIEVLGASFLNDVAVDNKGRVYVSDTVATKIYRIENSQVSVFAEGEAMEAPNGLLVKGNSLLVAGWGIITDPATFGTTVPGRLFTLDLDSKEKKLVTAKPFANLDGLEEFGKGYLCSDWAKGEVYFLHSNGKASLLLKGFKGAADIGIVPQKKFLIVPRMGEHKLSAYQLR